MPTATCISTYKKTSLGFQSIAAAGIGHAWAVGVDGTFWRNDGSRWVDAQVPLPAGAAATQVAVGNDETVWALDDAGRLCKYGTPHMPTPPTLNVTVPPVACRDASSALWLFCLDTEGALWTGRWSALDDWWGGLMSLGGPSGVSLESLSVGLNQDGGLQVFATGAGALWHTQQVAAGGGWSLWSSLGTPTGVSADNNLYSLWETAPGVWSSWGVVSPASVPIASLAVGQEANGCLGVVTVSTDKAVHYIAQTAPNNGWGAWTPLGAPSTGAEIVGPAIAQSANGALEIFVFAQSADPTLGTILQGDSWTTGWSNWLPLGQVQPLSWSPVAGAPVLQQGLTGPTSDGRWWAVDHEDMIVNWDGSQWSTMSLPDPSAKVASVAVGTDGSVWAVTVASSTAEPVTICYRYVNGAWQQASSGSFAHAPAGSANALWCVTLAGTLCRSTDGGHTWWQDTAFPATATQLAVGSDGTVWVLDAGGMASMSPAWQRIMRPTGMPGWPEASQCMAVVAGQDENGVRYVFYTTQSGKLVYSYEVFRHTWVEPILLAQQTVSGLGLTNQQDTGELIVYGLSSGGLQLLVARKAQDSDGFSFSAATVEPWFNSQRTIWPPPNVELCAVDANH